MMTVFGIFKVVGKSISVNSKNKEKMTVKIEDEFENKISMAVNEGEYKSYEIGDAVSIHKLIGQTTLDKKVD